MKINTEEQNTNVLMIIKADGMRNLTTILQTISEYHLSIFAMEQIKITEDQAKSVYQEHEGKYYHSTLVQYITMAPCFVLAIKGKISDILDAKKSIRDLAKREAERTCSDALVHFLAELSVTEKVKTNLGELASRFNSEYLKTFDGIHTSDIGAGKREIAIFFNHSCLNTTHFSPQAASEIIKTKLMNAPTPLTKLPLAEVSHQLNHSN